MIVALVLLFDISLLDAQWVQTGGLNAGTVHAFGISGTNLFAGTDSGVFLSTNNGASWTAANQGLTNTTVDAFAVSGANLFAGTQIGVYLSTNNGASWPISRSGLTDITITSLVVFTGNFGGINLFAATQGSGVYFSNDNGVSWSAVNSGLAVGDVLALAAGPDGDGGTNLIAGTSGGGVYLSDDNGVSWIAINSGLTTLPVSPLGERGANLVGGDSHEDLSTKIVTGSTINSELSLPDVFSLAMIPDGEGGANLFAGTSDGVYAYSGANWISASSGLTNLRISAFAVSGTNLFAGTYGGVFLSMNNGAYWIAVDSGLVNRSISALAVSGTYLFAAIDSTVWRRPLSELITTSVGQSHTGLPKQYNLEQNYPNPFNPTTTITYALPQQSKVRLSIYNLLGQELLTLVDRSEEAGYKSVSFDASALSSGVYFYRLEAGSFLQTKKLVLVK